MMKRIMFYSMLLCCAFFFGQTVLAQTTTAKQCTPEKMAACAKVCKGKAAETAQTSLPGQVGLTPQTVQVAQTTPAQPQANCAIKSCDPADCPLICKIICPLICSKSPAAAAVSEKAPQPAVPQTKKKS